MVIFNQTDVEAAHQAIEYLYSSTSKIIGERIITSLLSKVNCEVDNLILFGHSVSNRRYNSNTKCNTKLNLYYISKHEQKNYSFLHNMNYCLRAMIDIYPTTLIINVET